MDWNDHDDVDDVALTIFTMIKRQAYDCLKRYNCPWKLSTSMVLRFLSSCFLTGKKKTVFKTREHKLPARLCVTAKAFRRCHRWSCWRCPTWSMLDPSPEIRHLHNLSLCASVMVVNSSVWICARFVKWIMLDPSKTESFNWALIPLCVCWMTKRQIEVCF